MKMQKHHRQLLRMMHKRWPEMLLSLSHGGKHYKLMATFSGADIQVAVASTPACSEHMVNNTLHLIRQRFYAAGISLPDAAREI